MSPLARITIHSSQFPDAVHRELLASLRTRRVNHKFLYDSVKQTQKWLALHQAFSPSRNDADCAAIYDRSFAAVARILAKRTVRVIGLGCGGGQKDARLLKRLCGSRRVLYTPCDVSAAMVLVARRVALTVVEEEDCSPLVCDLSSVADLQSAFTRCDPRPAPRVITFFGMIPNFEPDTILPKLAACVRRGDHLLFSANLAPGPDYVSGVNKILPQYDNPPTRDWLMSFLLDLGISRREGVLRLGIEHGGKQGRLLRVCARFHFRREVELRIDDATFCFRRGESIRVFFSYRYSPERVNALLARHGLRVVDQWIARSEEEGVFLCARRW